MVIRIYNRMDFEEGRSKMKLSLMREFVTLANVQNFSRAAEELYIAQPALSRHIAALENELKTKLIDRSRNSFCTYRAGGRKHCILFRRYCWNMRC